MGKFVVVQAHSTFSVDCWVMPRAECVECQLLIGAMLKSNEADVIIVSCCTLTV